VDFENAIDKEKQWQSRRRSEKRSSVTDILARPGFSMIEGWFGDDYLISFNEAEVGSASDRYSISRFIPGYQVIGLRGWDDLIVRDSVGLAYTVPCVPMDSDLSCDTFFPRQSPGWFRMSDFSGK
jgi:hypothetical protein